jgi:membrane protein YqaA with SNARE-associated domain
MDKITINNDKNTEKHPRSNIQSAAKADAGLIKRLYNWVLHWADTPYGTPALFILSFAESSFFPVPPDVLQIALSVSKPRRSFYYATISGIASVLGALLGWYIGYALWAVTHDFFFNWIPGFTPEHFAAVESRYNQNAFLAIAFAGFTPIPYKVFTITAGVCSVPLQVLIFASIIGRFARFYLVATCLFFFGPKVKDLLDKYFGIITLLIGAAVIAGFVAIKYLL